MRRHLGLIVFGATLLVTLVAYLVLVMPIRAEIGSLVERILAVNTAEMADRVERTPGRDDEALATLRARLEGVLPPIGDRWERLERSGVPDTAEFKALFDRWLTRMQDEGILESDAWPRAAWRSGQTLPSLAEKQGTALLMLLVEGLGRGLHEEADARILRVTPSETGEEAELTFVFDPELAGGLLDVLLAPTIGDGIYDLLEVDVNVDETDDARARVRLALSDPER